MTLKEKRNFNELARIADGYRRAGNWREALHAYEMAAKGSEDIAILHHNISLCHLSLGSYSQAAASSQFALKLDSSLWQSQVVRIKSLRKLGQGADALAELAEIPVGQHAPLEVERAALLLHEQGDAAQAAAVAQPFLTHAGTPDVELTIALAALYDPGNKNSETVSAALSSFARDHLGADVESIPVPKSVQAKRRRHRIGVISPQFSASPIYFFGIGALTLLANDSDLYFFNRGHTMDWGTQAFQEIASEWIDAEQLDSNQLEQELRRHSLDVLIDMGGWMDIRALGALASKPARRMYKWVGGQSATTGLKSFDGFISDAYQSPLDLQALYTEPLVLLNSGYVTYTPPPYMPQCRPAEAGTVLGITANPLKLSRAFLAETRMRISAWSRDKFEPTLRFIDKRYKQDILKRRITDALGDVATIEFITPHGHEAYLSEVSKLSAVIDSAPYTGGLTTMEALSLGVPCYTKVGQLFSQRHTYAHCRYAGMPEKQCMLDEWQPKTQVIRSQPACIGPNSLRFQHGKLAMNLQRLFMAH